MELTIKPSHKNTNPLGGILIKNVSVNAWIKEIQWLNIPLASVQVYPIPGNVANSIWGCLLVTNSKVDTQKIGKNEACQVAYPNLFIPEKTALSPAITANEAEKLFSSARHIIHPEFGLVELTDALNLEALLVQPLSRDIHVGIPEKPVFIPQQIKSLQVYTLSPEEILKDLEKNFFPQQEELNDKPLNILEKGKLLFYKLLLGNSKAHSTNGNEQMAPNGKSDFLSKVRSFFQKLFKEKKWPDKMLQDFEELERRNKKKIDKLLDLLKNNLEEGLKYAIPLDNEGTGRGGSNAEFGFSKMWLDFSLFGGSEYRSTGGGSARADSNSFFELHNQYLESAKTLIAQKEYQKAAFVYMKLLKDYHKAAEVLEEGKYYKEAATVYIKHLHNKNKAAQCYEKGNMINNAIELYKELNEDEKVGDLYVRINKRKEANLYFEKVADKYKSNDQFVKASLVYKNKIEDAALGQTLLLQGWRENKDAFNCLNNYFSNLNTTQEIRQNLKDIYTQEVDSKNRGTFLQVIKLEYRKKNELTDYIREMAYEIVATQAKTDLTIVSELKYFNPEDKELMKDTIKFISNKRIKKNR